MKIQRKANNTFESTMLDDIFITDYMIHLDEKAIKIYIYLIYYLKNNNNINFNEISSALSLTKDELNTALEILENEELLLKIENGYELVDIKEKEVNRIYVPKIESKSTKAKPSTSREKAIRSINNMYFHGVMNLSWYTDIDEWFKRYHFDDDVMMTLFSYCKDKNSLNRRYIEVVAEAWGNKNIRTFTDLENYFAEKDKLKKVEKQITKVLRFNRNLTQYEEDMVERWITEYGYEFDVIEHAIKKTVSKTNPNISYINGIVSKWFEAGLKTLNEIKQNDNVYKEKEKQKKTEDKKFISREYDDFSQFYDNMK